MSVLSLNCYWGFSHLGYGTFSDNLHKGLVELGVEVLVNGADGSNDMRRPVPGVGASLTAALPGHLVGAFEGQHTTLFTMWEATRVPPMFAAHLWNYDLVIVPNDHNMEIFAERTVNQLVKVPLGYDSTVWKPMEREDPDETFRFLFPAAGAGEYSRKGSDVAIAAFDKAFPRWEQMSPSPRLVVKSLKALPEPRPFLELHQGAWPIEQLVELYGSCHAMVLPSRGEGWGYHPQQAVATGMPAIVSDIPGHLEYSRCPGFGHVPVVRKPAGRFAYGNAGDWWEPDLDVLAGLYRDVYENYYTWRGEARVGASIMRDEFDHVAMARNTISAVGPEHLAYKPTGPWREFKALEYQVVTKRDIYPEECSVNGEQFWFKQGVGKWAPAVVWEQLEMAGYLEDPTEIVARVPVE